MNLNKPASGGRQPTDQPANAGRSPVTPVPAIDANDIFLMNSDQLDALNKLSESRMGIYEHVGSEGGLVHLRELITGKEFLCLSTSGYEGRSGELWFVRRLPPLIPEMAVYHVVFTTPYTVQFSPMRLDNIGSAVSDAF